MCWSVLEEKERERGREKERKGNFLLPVSRMSLSIFSFLASSGVVSHFRKWCSRMVLCSSLNHIVDDFFFSHKREKEKERKGETKEGGS